jgi:hypothetical protein
MIRAFGSLDINLVRDLRFYGYEFLCALSEYDTHFRYPDTKIFLLL